MVRRAQSDLNVVIGYFVRAEAFPARRGKAERSSRIRSFHDALAGTHFHQFDSARRPARGGLTPSTRLRTRSYKTRSRQMLSTWSAPELAQLISLAPVALGHSMRRFA